LYILSNQATFLLFFVQMILMVIVFFTILNNKKASDVSVLGIITAIYIIFIWSRDNFGTDEFTYRYYYSQFLDNSDSFQFEFSFYYLFSILRFFGVSVNEFNNTVATAYVALAACTANYCAKGNSRSLILYFYLFSSVSLDFIFNIYRQGFSFLFACLFIYSVLNERKKLACVFIFIAIGFHWSSIIILIACVISKIVKRKQKLLFCIILAISLLAFVVPLHLADIFRLLSRMPLVSIDFLNHIGNYLSGEMGNNYYELSFNGRFTFIIFPVISIAGFCLYFYSKIDALLFNIIMILILYSLLFLEMSYSFRNYYWVMGLLPFILTSVAMGERKPLLNNLIIVLGYHGIYSVITYYSFPIFYQVFAS